MLWSVGRHGEQGADIEPFSPGRWRCSRTAGAATREIAIGPLLVERCILLSKMTVGTALSSAKCTSRRQGASRGRRRDPCRPSRGPWRRGLSKSVAKAPIAPGGAKRIVVIPRFSSRSIPARSAFATDLDRSPSEPVPRVPCVSAGSHPVRLGDDGGGKWRSGRIVPAPTRQCRRKNRGIMREPPRAPDASARTILPERQNPASPMR